MLVKMVRAGPPFEPRRRPQAGKSGNPRSQNADIKDEVRGQIMEIQAVVEHEPPDKGMEWESQSAEEMGEEILPSRGAWGWE